MEAEFPWGQEVIEGLLPHRDPFLWVTRVVDCVPGESVTAELDVKPDLELFQGHFPAYPVLPGVIIMEALAQTAAIGLLTDDRFAGSLGFLAAVDQAKFRRQVRPGDVLTLKATIVKASKRMCVADVRASVDGELAAEARQKYVMAPPS